MTKNNRKYVQEIVNQATTLAQALVDVGNALAFHVEYNPVTSEPFICLMNLNGTGTRMNALNFVKFFGPK